MKRGVIVAATVALTVIVVGCFAAQLGQQLNLHYPYTETGRTKQLEFSSFAGLNAVSINQFTLLAVPPPTFSVQTTAPSQSYLENSTRMQIFEYVSQNPGVQFRAIASALCLPVGLAEYHLGILVRSGLVSFVRDGRYKRFFVSKRFSLKEMRAICLLRHNTAKRIIMALMRKSELSHCKLADEISISSQALTWQMKTLADTEFVVQVNDGIKTFYSLNGASAPVLEKALATVC